jgi:hypothetical protein
MRVHPGGGRWKAVEGGCVADGEALPEFMVGEGERAKGAWPGFWRYRPRLGGGHGTWRAGGSKGSSRLRLRTRWWASFVGMLHS